MKPPPPSSPLPLTRLLRRPLRTPRRRPPLPQCASPRSLSLLHNHQHQNQHHPHHYHHPQNRHQRHQNKHHQQSQPYHSHNHPPPPGPFTPTETTILSASLAHIPLHGFTPISLSLGAKDAGYLEASATNLFPAGAFSLVHYYLFRKREGLARLAATSKGTVAAEMLGLGVGAKVKALTWARLLENREVVGKLQEAFALMALPPNIPTSLQELSLLSDEIWHLAGDTSVDFSWYTKRASLSAIYASTELFMTTDETSDYSATREFLHRRFEDSGAVGNVVRDSRQWVGFTAGAAVNVLRSKGVRI